ncbi:hypothetical protein LCGC14_3082950, partial [marine sediment metagenome]
NPWLTIIHTTDALVDTIEVAGRPIAENAALLATHERLRADHDRVMAAIERYGGSFTLEDDAEQDRGPDDPFDPQGSVVLRYTGTADPEGFGTRRHGMSEMVGRIDFVDMLQMSGALWPDRVALAGVMAMDLPLGDPDSATTPRAGALRRSGVTQPTADDTPLIPFRLDVQILEAA